MSILFALYLSVFWFIHQRQRAAAIASLGVALGASLAMYLYHADSSLGLNF